jgi:hypothetical protein
LSGLQYVFFDTNSGSMEHGYWLGFEQSARDLEAIGVELREGLKVMIRMPDELEMMATLHRGDRFGVGQSDWWAAPIADTLRYLDGSESSS